MGGPTGRTKNAIIMAMETARQQGQRISVKELAAVCDRKISTISEHLSALAGMHPSLVQELNVRGQLELTRAGRDRARALQPSPRSIEDRGLIAAGPARPLNNVHDVFDLGLDPDTHFVFHVEGDSMIEYLIA